jgi:hypothetical protein
MRKQLGAQRYRDYLANPVARVSAIAMTLCYVAATHFLFANTLAQMTRIVDALS